jgi:hypothetical protein
MCGHVVKMGATFGGIEAIPPNESTRRPIGCRRIGAGPVRRTTSDAIAVRSEHRSIEKASSGCRPGSAHPGGDFIGNRDAHDRRE